MKLYVLFLSLALAALATAIANINDADWAIWIFGSFFVLLRMKEFLDDALDLLETKENKQTASRVFKAGFFFGVASWFFWIVAALRISNLALASRYLLVAFLISTAWVILALVSRRPKRKYVQWLVANSVYMVILLFCSLRDPVGQRPMVGFSYAVLILIGLLDLFMSKSYAVLERLDEV